MRVIMKKGIIRYNKGILLLLLIFVSICLTACGEMTETELNRIITMDDEHYKITIAEDGNYYVKLPEGRPRIPVLSCEEGKVLTQPFFPDGVDSTVAKVEKDGKIYAIRFIKDADMGFELQYDDRYKFIPKNFEGKYFKSSNPDIAKVDDLGNVKIVGLSDKGVNITASDGVQEETLRITRTIKATLSVYMLTGQSNGGYYYAEPEYASVTKPGTAYHYSEIAGGIRISSMNSVNGSMDRGNIEPGLAKVLYQKMGEKVLIVNSGVSGQKIETFVPMQGSSYQSIDRIWQIVKKNLNDDDFKSRYDVRLRSYIWVQGESDMTTEVDLYKNDFLKLHQMLRSKDYGFDYGFIVKVRSMYKNAAIAQEDLISENEDVKIGTRQTDEFTVADGTMRKDDLHYSQIGDNIIGEDTAKSIVKVYYKNAGGLEEDARIATKSEDKAI